MVVAAEAPGMWSQLCTEVGSDTAPLGGHLLPRSTWMGLRAITAHLLVDRDHALISQVCFNVYKCSMQGAKTHPKLNDPPERAM